MCAHCGELCGLLLFHALHLQEAAGKGLALVYECGDAEAQRSLVSSLLASFETGKRAPALPPPPLAPAAVTTPATNDPTLVWAAAPPPAPAPSAHDVGAGPAGMSLSAAGDGAYRELCAMANEAGNPELIYRFLALSSHHAAWHTRGGAGMALEALLSTRAKAALAPHLEALIPRIFRFMYDPAPRVRESSELLTSRARRFVYLCYPTLCVPPIPCIYSGASLGCTRRRPTRGGLCPHLCDSDGSHCGVTGSDAS